MEIKLTILLGGGGIIKSHPKLLHITLRFESTSQHRCFPTSVRAE